MSRLLPLLCLASLSLPAQISDSMTLLGTWDDESLPTGFVRYNDVWGYAAPDGREYALLGSLEFVHVLDVTDPAAIAEVARLNDVTTSPSIWRDMKTYRGYAYAVADQRREGLQVIDLSRLPDTATVVFRDNSQFITAHNIWIDSLTQPARLYAYGVNADNPGRDGVVVYGLADPAKPEHLANVPLPGEYVHDAYVRGDTLWANHGNAGLFVYDLADLGNPVELGRLTAYREQGYNHSGYLSDNGRTYVFCDETFDRGVKVVDVSDPNDLEITSIFRSTLIEGQDESIAHNPFVLGDSLVVLSYYDEGIQVWDIRDPAAPVRRGYYDTTPDQTDYTASGVWGAYPYLPSGIILGSDTRTGLYVLRLDGPAGTTAARDRPAAESITVFPNPVASGQALRIVGAGPREQYELRSTDGRLVRAGNGGQVTLPAGLAAGVYVLRSGRRVGRVLVR